jgi:hypothetical protein
MLYFDRMQEEHFGSIRQQAWSFLHFPLHTVLVLVLQGVSLLIIWRQAVESLNALALTWEPALVWLQDGGTLDNSTYFGAEMSLVSDNYTVGEAFANYFNWTCYDQVYDYIPKGVDASKEIKTVANAWVDIQQGLDNVYADQNNETAFDQLYTGINAMASATYKTLFDTFSVTVAKSKNKKSGDKEVPDLVKTHMQYYRIFDLILSYTFIAVSFSMAFSATFSFANISSLQGGLALIITALLGYLSLPQRQRRAGTIVRLAVTATAGLGLCLVSLIRFSETHMYEYLGSAWMIPTICLTLFFCVVVDHIGMPKKKAH